MTPSDLIVREPKPSSAPVPPASTAVPPGSLAEDFVLLDNSSGSDARSLMFSSPVEIVVAREAADVDGALTRLEAGIARGLHAAGFFSYELGYVLEPKPAAAVCRSRATCR